MQRNQRGLLELHHPQGLRRCTAPHHPLPRPRLLRHPPPLLLRRNPLLNHRRLRVAPGPGSVMGETGRAS